MACVNGSFDGRDDGVKITVVVHVNEMKIVQVKQRRKRQEFWFKDNKSKHKFIESLTIMPACGLLERFIHLFAERVTRRATKEKEYKNQVHQ